MIAFDSNILIYIAGLSRTEDDLRKQASLGEIIARLSEAADIVAPAQALGEVYHVCQRKGWSRERSREFVLVLNQSFKVVGSKPDSFLEAVDLATDHKLQFWDALILNVVADAGCTLLLSEDMQDGFAWRGVTVADPFAKKMHRRLARVLAG
jgi:predicted nucleic acid-binding protein